MVGEHCRDNDLPVSVWREKKLTNIRVVRLRKIFLKENDRKRHARQNEAEAT